MSADQVPPQLADADESEIDGLLADAHVAATHELPALIARHAAALGAVDAVACLADLQQSTLVPFLGADGTGVGGPGWPDDPIRIDGTLAGRCFQHVEVHIQDLSPGYSRVWLPLLDGAERLGVLGLTVDAQDAARVSGQLLGRRMRRFAAIVAELIMTKSFYGDTIACLRRREGMGLAAEMQWSLLPPLTFACRAVTVSAALEPAYEVAGDTLDYAVDDGRARAAVFDGMGHGLHSAQLASLTIAAYRNARRSGRALADTTAEIHKSLIAAGFPGTTFVTAVLTELNTDTGVLSWVNAGHPEPLLVRDEKLVKTLHASPWLPLGLELPSRPTQVSEADIGREQLQPGDRVVLYTDGVTEGRNSAGEFFGDQRLSDLIVRNFAAGLPAPETMRRVVRALLDHQEGQLTDDATLLMLEWQSTNISALLPP